MRGKRIDNFGKSGIMEMYRKDEDDNFNPTAHYISRKRLNQLTVEARKNAALIIIDDPWFNNRMKEKKASAVTYGDVIAFRKNITISDALEETYHFKQNLHELNNDKPKELREIINEIDAKEYLLKVANKYKIPRSKQNLRNAS